MKHIAELLLTVACVLPLSGAFGARPRIGFSQIGSETGWREAETSITRAEAPKHRVILKSSDGQQSEDVPDISRAMITGDATVELTPKVAWRYRAWN